MNGMRSINRPSLRLAFATVLAIGGIGVAVTNAGAAAAATPRIYASPHGSGSHCSSSRPCSIQYAQKAARAQASRMRSDINVILAGGTYPLVSPLTFTAADSGQHGHTIVWQAAPDAHPVLSGGTGVSGWKADPTTPGLWRAPVAASLQTRELWADGAKVPRSAGSSPVALTQTDTGFTAADATMATWRNPSQIEFVFSPVNAWNEMRCPVASIHGTAITMAQPCWANTQRVATPIAANGDNPSGGFGSLSKSATPSSIENAYELLSAGHWYLDRTAHALYYQARPGEDVRHMSFVAGALESVVTSTATPQHPLHDVTFRGLQFSHTTWAQPSGPDGYSEIQASATVTGVDGYKTQGLCEYVQPTGGCPFENYTEPPAAVDLAGTRHVSIVDDVFTHIGDAGLRIFHGGDHDLVQGNEITDTAAGGIELGSMDDAEPLRGDPAETLTHNTIKDNYIHRIATEFHGGVGIWVLYTKHTLISHNQISDTPYDGLSIGWGGHHTDAVTPNADPNINADNVIANNMFTNTMQLLSDGGPMYSEGRQATSWQHALEITGNVSFGSVHPANFMYHDEGSRYIVIAGNAEYGQSGNFNGGCSTAGPVLDTKNYHVGGLNQVGCNRAGAADQFIDDGTNVAIPDSPGPGVVPNRLLAGAGLEPRFAGLVTRQAPSVSLVSPFTTSGALISGSGFSPNSTLRVGSTRVPFQYLSPNYLVAHPAKDVGVGYLTVANAHGTSNQVVVLPDPSHDVAIGKPATESSVLSGYGGHPEAGSAVDGNTDGAFGDGSMSHTEQDPNAWWQVDLGSTQPLAALALWNRTDYNPERDTDYWVFVSDAPFDPRLTPAQQAARPGVWSSHQTGQMGRPTAIIDNITGRYVMVQLAGTNYLALAEVQAFAQQP